MAAGSEALKLSGVMCYSESRQEAIANAERLAIEVIADRIAHSELPSSAFAVSFPIPDEQLAASKPPAVLDALERIGWRVNASAALIGCSRARTGRTTSLPITIKMRLARGCWRESASGRG
jgi:hypothetical protein